jgi:HNH endonuclease
VRYWWVNHNLTSRHELAGGYLWSPKKEANGARSQFYNNMRIVAPGDKVLSFVESQIGHVGVALDFAVGAPKPPEFGDAGAYWSDEGWQLPIAWRPLPARFRPKPLIKQFAQWLPDKYSPIGPESGNGHEKAYLCEIREEVFRFLVEQGGGEPEWEELFDVAASPPGAAAETTADKQLPYGEALSDSERDRLVKIRYGQSIFRDNVSEIETGCRLTGVTNPTLLTAGHIKPWRSCSSTQERLDGANGLLLTPHVDRLFDRGLISFADTGEVLLSPRLSAEDIDRLGLRDACKQNTGAFSEAQQAYLAYHRKEVFLR